MQCTGPLPPLRASMFPMPQSTIADETPTSRALLRPHLRKGTVPQHAGQQHLGQHDHALLPPPQPRPRPWPSKLTWLHRGPVTLIRRAAHALADFIMPPVCLMCNDALGTHDALCAGCWSQINFIRPPLCDATGLPLPYDTGGRLLSADAIAQPPRYDRARAVAHHTGIMQDLVLSFKYADRHDARRLFGRWLYATGTDLYDGVDWIMPVPLNRIRLLSRRYNQSALLAQEVARLTGLSYQPLVLLRPRRTQSQVGKTADQRRRNVAGAFAISPKWRTKLAGKNVLLIDDVITTGATVNACARTLKKAGAARVDVLALSKTTDRALDNL